VCQYLSLAAGGSPSLGLSLADDQSRNIESEHISWPQSLLAAKSSKKQSEAMERDSDSWKKVLIFSHMTSCENRSRSTTTTRRDDERCGF